MRLAALLLAWAPGIWLAAACTPREDLEAYSAGARETREGPLEPSLAANGEPAEVEGSEPGADPASIETDVNETTPNTDGQGQPAGLADDGSDGDGAGSPGQAPAGGAGDAEPPDEPPEEPPSDPPATMPPATMPPATMPPATMPPATMPPATTPPPAPTQFRFVRLVADSEVNGGPLSSIAELGVLGADGQPLSRTGWVASADSAEPTYVGGAPAAMAIDGDAATMWHTPWFEVVPPPHPHFIQVDLGQARRIQGFRYLARQDGAFDGRVLDYRFYVSVDGVDFGGPVAAGRLANSDQSQDVRLAPP